LWHGARALLPLAKAKGLVVMHEAGRYRPGAERTDYRVPDLVYARPEHVSERGVEGRAELVVEVLSAGDETYEKIAFYAEMGVQELLVIDPATARVELFLTAEGLPEQASPATGTVTVQALGVTITPGPGGRLRLDWVGGNAEL
jgi:Uma2 family endonuclease